MKTTELTAGEVKPNRPVTKTEENTHMDALKHIVARTDFM